MNTFTPILRNFAQMAAITLVVLLCSGCGVLRTVGILDKPPAAPAPPAPLPSQVPYTLSLSIKTSIDLNPSATSRASPVRMRLFLTEPDKDLLSAPFETLFEFDGAVPPAQPDAVIVMAPGSRRTIELNGMKSQNQLVVAVAFHDVYSANWIARKMINTDNPGSSTVAIGSSSVEIQ